MTIYHQTLKSLASILRKGMTPQEIFLWRKISRKQLGDVQFYRQKPIGPYIVDFYAKKPKIVIELGGGHHYEPKQIELDNIRDEYLKDQGFIVLRFDNRSVIENWPGVGQCILDAIASAESRSKDKGP